MKPFQKLSTTIRYSYEIDGKITKGRVRAFMPPMDQLPNFATKFFSQMKLEELNFILKMLKFAAAFPLENNEYVDYQEMIRCGLILKNDHISPIENKDVKTLFYHAVKGSILEMNMSELGYYSFRDMVLTEYGEYDQKLDDMFNKSYRNKIKELSFTKRFLLLIKHKKIDNIKETFRKETWSMISSTANSYSNKMAEKEFPKRALELQKNFNNNKYNELVHDVISEFELLFPNDYKDIISYLKDSDNLNKKENILDWIIDNTCSTETAFENIKREADYINKEIFHKYCLYFYKNHKKVMKREEKRLYQLCFFRREDFQYRIPALDGFMRSFWDNNMQLIFTGLILKGINPDYKQDNKQLEEKWREFLSIYPNALNNRNLYNHLNDPKKIKEMINRNFNGNDMLILNAFVDGYEIDTIQARFGCSRKYCLDLIERYKKDAKL